MAEGNFGNLSKEEFAELRAELTNFQDGVSQAQQAFNQLLRGADLSGLVDNTRKASNAARDLAKATQDDLTSQKGRNELMRRYNDIKREQNSVESKILVIKRQIELANKDELVSLQAALKGALDFADQLDGAAKAAEQVATQVNKVAEAGAGFEKVSNFLKEIPIVGKYLGSISGQFDKASAAAKKAKAEGLSDFQASMRGSLELSQNIAIAIGTAIVGAIIQGSKRLGDLNKQLGMGLENARSMAERFDQFATASEDSRITTEKLIAANGQLNQALGTTVEFSGETLENFILTTEYMGVSVESAAKLETLARTTGQNTKDFAGSLAESVSQAGKNNNLFISTGKALEKVKNLSATTLLNLRRNPKVIGEAIVETEKLGLSFDKLRGIASSLLDFESSIQKELEAELLTGRELNLERARAAALRGDDLALAKELTSQVGTLTEFEQMNVIQRESLANAFGLSSDAMSEMLLKQELLNSLGEEARDLSAEQAATIRQMVEDGDAENEQDALLRLQQEQDITKRFQDAVGKLKSAFVDFFEDFEPAFNKLVDVITGLTESSMLKTILGAVTSIGGLTALAGVFIASKLRGTPAMPMFVTSMGGAGGGAGMMGFAASGAGVGGKFFNKGTTYKGGQFMPGGGRAPAGGATVGRGLTAGGAMGLAGVGMLAGGLMQQSDNENVQMAGSALSGAGTGAMMGMMFGPIGAGIGAAVGGLGSLLMAHQRKQEEREAKAAKIREEAEAKKLDEYSMMEKHLREIAEKETDIYMDGNKMNVQQGLAQTKVP